jgi:uncharacterized protein YjbI with pentapeptide repeats
MTSGKEKRELLDDSQHGNLSRKTKKAVDATKERVGKLANSAEWVLGRRTARVLGLAALFAVALALLFVLLNWFISPNTAQQRQGLALVLAIGLGGIAGIVGLYFTRQTLITTRELEGDRAREAALRGCLEQLGRLLTADKWSTATADQAGETLRNLARAEALSVLGSLDGPRKRILVRFLYESRLLNKENPTVDLNGANLSEVDLNRSHLPNAALSRVRLRGANLSRATLVGSDLSGSDLRDLSNGDLIRTNLSAANLSDTNLSSTDLRGVDLREANLRNADLREADLQGAQVTDKQLADTLSLQGTTMPDGSKHP